MATIKNILFSLLILLLYNVINASLIPVGSDAEEKCNYENCPKLEPKKLNVHLIAHTHDDVGWLKTVDQYYYGSNSKDANAGVQYILDSVIMALSKSPDRRFIWVETAFFWMWWKEQDEPTKNTVINLVKSGMYQFLF
jgi:lysosomal alpha-mannosidase